MTHETLKSIIADLEHYGPAKSHEGPCTPETQCDSLCEEAAVFASRLEAYKAGLPKETGDNWGYRINEKLSLSEWAKELTWRRYGGMHVQELAAIQDAIRKLCKDYRERNKTQYAVGYRERESILEPIAEIIVSQVLANTPIEKNATYYASDMEKDVIDLIRPIFDEAICDRSKFK